MSDPLSGVIPQRQGADDDPDAMAHVDAGSRLNQLIAAVDVDLDLDNWSSLHHELARYGLAIVLAWLRSGEQLPTDSTTDTIVDAVVRSAGVREPTMTTSHPSPTTTAHPTSRQLQVLQLVADGHTDRKIGTLLGVDHSTVGNHLTQLAERLGIKGAQRAKLVANGFRQGWIR